jgi:hypothetical protein
MKQFHKLILILSLIVYAANTTNAQGNQHEFVKLIETIFEHNPINFPQIEVSDLGNPNIVILKNEVISELYGKDVLIQELISEKPRTFILEKTYLLGYEIKSYLEFRKIRIKMSRASISFTFVDQASNVYRYTFRKKKGDWILL